MERLLAATGGLFSRKRGNDTKKDIEGIFQDARLVSTSRTNLGRPANLAKGLRNGEQKAVKGSKGQYELDGDLEKELQAELGELVQRVHSTHYAGRLSELDVDELLEDALEDDGPDAQPQQMSVAMWEEKLAAESRRKQQLQQQQRQKPRRKSGFGLADTDVQVERSSASCSALQHQQRRALPRVNLKSKTAQEDTQQLLGTPLGAPPGLKRGELKLPSRELPTCNPPAVRTRGSAEMASTKPVPLTISSDSYDSPCDASPASPASQGMFAFGSLERSNTRAHRVLPPLQIQPSRAVGSPQDGAHSRSSTPGSTRQPQPNLWEHQGSLLSRISPKGHAGQLAPINAPGLASVERSGSQELNSRIGGISLAPLGGSGGLMGASLRKKPM
ncbi:hypothetical protein DUNSADRAFT_11208 [Dunaliella salina]|uniref:Uncharacterized protein n=1 Tax=Dunaliella salina TaxID=3046 RepID=A0ABQ7GDW4_DUNSA|nr:hypothetical protein DUNSADRAFT_11208 [Dunaliella salina]|eukprot:KAF5832799.1 hypothetical protein DUNSADRAFT_11208 [Dunaliella salina]